MGVNGMHSVTRLTVLLFVSVLAWSQTGCQGCQMSRPELVPERDVVAIDIAFEEPELEWSAPDEVAPPPYLLCSEEGLLINGELMVPSDPMEDPSPECESSSLDLFGGGAYTACCDQECCSFQPEDSVGSRAEGEECLSDEQCLVGLICRAGEEGGLRCAYVPDGGACGQSRFCAPDLYCGTDHLCHAPTAEEGGVCAGTDQSCAWPMSCVCEPSPCLCWDGSAGDPCNSDTCAEGLFCGEPEGEGLPGVCFEGVVGDPCMADWQCDPGLGCTGVAGGKSVCADWLGDGEECFEQGEEMLVTCPSGLACLAFLDPPVCGEPGDETAPCAKDSDCASPLFCNSTVSLCFDGKNGDPCEQNEQCRDAFECLPGKDGAGQCMQVLEEGDVCGGSPSDWMQCGPGLVCLYSAYPPVCGAPTGPGQICVTDLDCGEGLVCAESAGICLSGLDGETCASAGDCQPGLYCAGVPKECCSGDFGDPCNEGKCAEGFTCNAKKDRCFDGGPGSPCVAASDCKGAGQCVQVWEGWLCLGIIPLGGPCGAENGDFALCGSGLFCADPPGQCSSGKKGEPCADTQQCVAGLVCHPDLLECLAGELGDPCSESFPCGEGLVCTPESAVCAHAVEGEWCAVAADCALPLFCVPFVSECHDGDNGDPCAKPADCGPGFDCLMPVGQCYDTLAGSPCIGDAWCAEGLSCVDVGGPKCMMLAQEGDPCGAPYVTFILCPDGMTCNSGYAPSQCKPPGGPGAPCWEDEDCLPGHHCVAQTTQCEADPVDQGGQP